ncbi:hypothetical protein BST81_08605 [Leptolyngbya sp. 'hensonii']|uniref:hypothetical protein n=1 Tax=Leptolyngbya sp. 'hensonii' TaxID=1922337 RepID=UPI00095B5BBC|nr:hypothetical protein [Leptolyngbya sp. 'hensonii']OLP18790.1 hypothetical protein BST81_08605 [Leptolyngbya sp. 'hensonii']
MVKGVMQWTDRIRQSLKYRLFHGYCNVLRQIKAGHLPTIGWQPFDATLPIGVITTRVSDVPLLAYNLASMMARVQRRPSLWLVGDSDAAYQELQIRFAGAPPEVQLFHWQMLLDALPANYHPFITDWSQRRWGGFAKKFTAYLAANHRSDVLLLDADILWFGNFLAVLEALLQTGHTTMLAGRDYQQSYDLSIIEALHDRRLLEEDPMNIGLAYCPQGILPRILFPEKLESLRPCLEKDSFYFEQTLMAHVFWQVEGRWFDEATLATTLVDDFRLTSSVKALIRHYAGGKHLFWRDA